MTMKNSNPNQIDLSGSDVMEDMAEKIFGKSILKIITFGNNFRNQKMIAFQFGSLLKKALKLSKNWRKGSNFMKMKLCIIMKR